jgi:hypothetical protein
MKAELRLMTGVLVVVGLWYAVGYMQGFATGEQAGYDTGLKEGIVIGKNEGVIIASAPTDS